MTTDPERIVQLAEWMYQDFPGVSLTSGDRALAEGLQERLVVEELRHGVRLRSSSWIGVVRFESFEVRVVPKLAGDHLHVLQMIEQTDGLDALHRSSGLRQLDAAGTDLHDLFALLFAEECERIANGGLFHDYVEIEDWLPALRGRLLFDRQVLERFGRLDRLACRCDDLRTDVVENRLLAAALVACAPRVRHAGVRQRLRRLVALFREICDLENFAPQGVEEPIAYHRLNEHYRQAHDLARLLLREAGMADLFRGGTTRSFAFLLDMNLLFERFIERFVRHALAGMPVQVRYQHRDRSILWNATTRRPHGAVIPDLLVERRGASGTALAIDAKYKTYDHRRVVSTDLYQAFLYAYAFGGAAERPSALLLYPCVSPSGEGLRLDVRTSGIPHAEIHVLGMHVPTVLHELSAHVQGPCSTALAAVVTSAMAIPQQSVSRLSA